MTSGEPPSALPLVRYLSRCNAATRTEARRLVLAGRVRVNGRVCTDGARRVDGTRDQVDLDGRAVRLPRPDRDLVWFMLNKPRGVVTTTSDPEGRQTVLDLVPRPHARGLAPVGRLDKASAGLLLLTNDSVLAARLLDPARHVLKSYRVKVRGHPAAETLRRWRRDSLEVAGLVLGPMDVTVEKEGPASTWLRVRLAEGKNRQIRRRCEAEGHAVQILVRVAFGPLDLGELAPGVARRLTRTEIASLRQTEPA